MRRVGLFLAAEPYDGGAFQYSQSVLKALADSKQFELTVAYTNDAWHELLTPFAVEKLRLRVTATDTLLLKCVKFGLIPLGAWRALAGRSNHLARTVVEQACDVWLFPSQDAWSYFLPVPSIVSIFDLMHRYERRFPEVSSGFKFQRRELHYRRICRTARALLVDSTVGAEQVRESYGVGPPRIHVLPFIAPPHVLGDSGAEPVTGVPEKYFFYPAQFWSHKNHLRLIRALAEVAEQCPDVHLVLVGSKKNNYERVRSLIDELQLADHVTILGYVQDSQMATLYRNARALVMPTFFGPTNIPPLEAMALGCPVAVSDIYAMREQMGGAALLFDPGSVESIRDAMLELWNDDTLCAELAGRGAERTSEWTQSQFTSRLQEIVDATIHAPSSAVLRQNPVDG